MKDRDYRNLDEEKNRRVKGTFYIVVSVITLVVAVIGASFSYFIASSSSSPDVLNTSSTSFSVNFVDNEVRNLLNPDLIPADNNVVYYSVANQEFASNDLYDSFYESSTNFNLTDLANTKCRDDRGYAVCSLYTFKITNPENSGFSQELNVTIEKTLNTFENLHLMVLDPENVDPEAQEKTGVVLNDYHFTADNEKISPENGRKYYDLNNSLTVTLQPGESKTYQLVIYIKNLEDVVEEEVVTQYGDQTAADSEKSFIASVVVSPKDGSSKIYGVIDAASSKFDG